MTRDFYLRFVATASRFPDRTAVELQRSAGSTRAEERFTFSQLRGLAEHLGSWLQTQSFSAGSRCAILAANGPRWVAAYLGIMSANLIAVPLDTAFKPEQVAKLLRDSGASLLFVDIAHYATGEAAWQQLGGSQGKLVVIDTGAGRKTQNVSAIFVDDILATNVPAVEHRESADDDVCMLLYTSGTTADPKGVMLTHRNLNAETDGVLQVLEVDERDVLLGVLPLFHVLAQMANLLIPFAIGASVVYLETLNTTELLRALQERGITIFACVPQFFYLIHERVMKQVESRGRVAQAVFRGMLLLSAAVRPLGLNLGRVFFAEAHRRLGTQMRYLITGGSRFDPAIGRDLRDMGFNLLQAYGLTETAAAAALTPPNDNVLGSVGKVIPGNEIRIGKSEHAGEGEGEILIRGPLIMKGYYNRPEATAEVIRDGWLHTGDLGRIDERGNLFVTGRSKDIIVLSNGKNVYPEEIEAHYLQSPVIKEICVMGLESRPGEPLAERLHAVIVPNFEMLRERKVVNAREVIRFDIEGLSAKLPATKRVLSYDIWQQDLPRTTTRKLKRFEIRRRALENAAGEESQSTTAARSFSEDDRLWLADTSVQQAITVIRGASKKDGEIHPDDNLELDLGLDSMERVELVVALESALGAHVEEQELAYVYSVRELVNTMLAHRSAGAASRESGWDAVFASDPEDPDVAAILAKHTIATPFWFTAARVARWLSRAFYKVEIEGLENLPSEGPFILAPNHQSFIDAPMLMSFFPFRIFSRMFYVGTSEIFGTGVRKRIGRSMRLVPIDPDANLIPAMRAGGYGLRRGQALVLYPEGERSITGEPRTFKKGAAILASHLHVPIVPVALEGFEQAWGRGKGIRLFKKLAIKIGAPVEPPVAINISERTYEELTRKLRDRVLEMWHELRGDKKIEERELVDSGR